MEEKKLISNSIWFNSTFVDNAQQFWLDCPDWLKIEMIYDAGWRHYNYFMELTGLKTKFLSMNQYVSTLHSAFKDKEIPYPYTPYKSGVITIGDSFKPAIQAMIVEKNLDLEIFKTDMKNIKGSLEQVKLHNKYMNDNYSKSDWVGLVLYAIKRSVTTEPKTENIHRRTVWLSKIIAKTLGHDDYAKNTDDALNKYRSTIWGGVKSGGFAFSPSAIFTLDFLHFVEYHNWQIDYPINKLLETFNYPKSQENKALYTIEEVFDEDVYSEGKIGYIDSKSKIKPTKNPRLSWLSDFYCNNNNLKPAETNKARFNEQAKFLQSQPFYKNSAIWKIYEDYEYTPVLQKKMYVPIPFVSKHPYTSSYVFINWIGNPLAKTVKELREEQKRKRIYEYNKGLHTNVEKEYHNQKNVDRYYNYILENTKYHINHALTESNHSVKNRDLKKGGLYLDRGILYEIHNYVIGNLKEMKYREDEGGGHIKGGQYNTITLADILGVISHLPLNQLDTMDARRLNEVYILVDRWINENVPKRDQVKKRPQALNSYLTADRTALNRFLSFTGDLTPHLGDMAKNYPNIIHIKDKRLTKGATSVHGTIYLIYPAVEGSSRGNKNYFLPKWLFLKYQ